MKKIFSSTKNLLNKIFSFFENAEDKKVVRETDFRKGKDFELLTKKLNIK